VADRKIVVLGTGGTLAGISVDPHDNVGYCAAQLGIAQLLAAIPALALLPLVSEQVAQIDSKDMDDATWAELAGRCRHWLGQPDVTGLVVTHGTDTLEETAYFLQAVLAPVRPVVLTCAMRPASALFPDGPQNIVDAITVARWPGASGVVAVCAGVIHGAPDVRKQHTYRLDAFGSGDAGPIGYVEEGRLRLLRDWPGTAGAVPHPAADAVSAGATWPHVEIITSHAGASGRLVDSLVRAGVRGLVVAGTGNGTVHQALEQALLAAQAQAVQVLLTTRCAQGQVIGSRAAFDTAHGLTPVQARIALQLRLLAVRPVPPALAG
jgi:L-asparaginase